MHKTEEIPAPVEAGNEEALKQLDAINAEEEPDDDEEEDEEEEEPGDTDRKTG